MSRISLVAACVLLTFVGKAVGEDATARSPRSTVQIAEDRIDAVLDGQLKAPLDFIDAPLFDVVNKLQEDYGIPILFDAAALDEVAISPDTEVTVSLSYITLRSALDLLLRQPELQDLTTIIDKEVLLITTKDVADATLQTKVYRADGFEYFSHPKSESKSKENCYSSLQHVITSCIEFNSWQVNGTGKGDTHLMKPGLLVVSQTRSVHRKIEKLIADLRTVKLEIERNRGESSGGEF